MDVACIVVSLVAIGWHVVLEQYAENQEEKAHSSLNPEDSRNKQFIQDHQI
jgi:hypothetical protein